MHAVCAGKSALILDRDSVIIGTVKPTMTDEEIKTLIDRELKRRGNPKDTHIRVLVIES